MIPTPPELRAFRERARRRHARPCSCIEAIRRHWRWMRRQALR